MIVFNGFQVCIHESRVESKSNNTFDDHPTSGLGSPCVIYVMELDIPSVMENDGIVLEYAVDKELEDYQYLRVATGHLKESLDEIVEELRRQEGTTCLCFSFTGFALLAVDSRVTGPDMLTVSKISVVNNSLHTKICRCGDLYESVLLIEGKEGKMEHKRSHNRVARANVCRQGHPLALLEGGYILHVVKLGSLGSIKKTIQRAATSSVIVLEEFVVENSYYIEMRVFELSFTKTMVKRKRKLTSNVYIGRAGDNLLECLKESNH
ncbi:hypothetical protein ACFX2I_036663 [Malus domestica]